MSVLTLLIQLAQMSPDSCLALALILLLRLAGNSGAFFLGLASILRFSAG